MRATSPASQSWAWTCAAGPVNLNPIPTPRYTSCFSSLQFATPGHSLGHVLLWPSVDQPRGRPQGSVLPTGGKPACPLPTPHPGPTPGPSVLLPASSHKATDGAPPSKCPSLPVSVVALVLTYSLHSAVLTLCCRLHPSHPPLHQPPGPGNHHSSLPVDLPRIQRSRLIVCTSGTEMHLRFVNTVCTLCSLAAKTGNSLGVRPWVSG